MRACLPRYVQWAKDPKWSVGPNKMDNIFRPDEDKRQWYDKRYQSTNPVRFKDNWVNQIWWHLWKMRLNVEKNETLFSTETHEPVESI